MSMLTDQIDLVIGIDTHKRTHTAAFVDRLGNVHGMHEIEANAAGYRQLLCAADAHAGERLWAVEGTGSYGAGLTTALTAAGERVVEVERPGRPKRRPAGKSDPIDAVRAAREILAHEHQIEPCQRGNREAIRVLSATRNGAVLHADQSVEPSPHAHRYRTRTAPRSAVGNIDCRVDAPLRRAAGPGRHGRRAPSDGHGTACVCSSRRSRAVKKPTNSNPSSSDSCGHAFLSCSTSPASDPSPRRSSISRGRTTARSETTPRSPRWLVSLPSRHRRVRPPSSRLAMMRSASSARSRSRFPSRRWEKDRPFRPRPQPWGSCDNDGHWGGTCAGHRPSPIVGRRLWAWRRWPVRVAGGVSL